MQALLRAQMDISTARTEATCRRLSMPLQWTTRSAVSLLKAALIACSNSSMRCIPERILILGHLYDTSHLSCPHLSLRAILLCKLTIMCAYAACITRYLSLLALFTEPSCADCCDGSDEGLGVCPSTCQEAGSEYRAALRAQSTATKLGLKAKEKYISKAAAKRLEWQKQVEKLNGEEANLQASVTGLQGHCPNNSCFALAAPVMLEFFFKQKSRTVQTTR